jgi:hypothetical protein
MESRRKEQFKELRFVYDISEAMKMARKDRSRDRMK